MGTVDRARGREGDLTVPGGFRFRGEQDLQSPWRHSLRRRQGGRGGTATAERFFIDSGYAGLVKFSRNIHTLGSLRRYSYTCKQLRGFLLLRSYLRYAVVTTFPGGGLERVATRSRRWLVVLRVLLAEGTVRRCYFGGSGPLAGVGRGERAGGGGKNGRCPRLKKIRRDIKKV